jgi:chemotaxis protein methyltransferase WspC
VTGPDFEGLLCRHIGLDVASVGSRLVATAVAERQLQTGLADTADYWQRLTSSAAELEALIDRVIVSETWFFRDPAAFAALVREAMGPGLASRRPGPLRLLSLPCATGEEPYSMAMALLDAGFSEQALLIDAVDISERSLCHARRASYGNNSFRGSDLGFRDRYFEGAPPIFRLCERVRARVTFQRANLLSADVALGASGYDAIFCRNVLIYLDREAQLRALDVLARLSRPEGLLFVGPSETALVPRQMYESLGVPLAFAFRKRTRQARSSSPRPRVAHPARPLPAAAAPTRTAAASSPRLAPSPPAPAPAAASVEAERDIVQAQLDRVAELADRGQLAEASRLCAEHLRRHPPSARLYYLMGLLREAEQAPADAAALHKKALYLDPDHEEAMLHLALLLEKQGDAVAAERLRGRARRLARRESA